MLTIVTVRRTWRKVAGLPAFDQENDTKKFTIAAEDLLLRTEKSVKNFKRYFPVFIINRDVDTLTIELSPEEGTYMVEVDEDTKCLYYLSPLSGRHTYVLNAQTNEWISPEDGHLFLTKLTRELNRQCSERGFLS